MAKISPSQLRAARALLNWSRLDLSKLSDISEPTLHRLENGVNEPEIRTTKKLLNVFDSHGVEFSEHQGVRFRPSNIDVYDGIDRFNDFYDFLYDHLYQFGGDVCVSIYNELLLARLRKDPNLHLKRMKKLFDRRKITFRILTTISDFDPSGYASFKWLPNQPPSPAAFYAFGDCLALMSFVDEKSPYVVVIRSAPMAEAYRQGFNVAWMQGQNPPSPPEIERILAKERSSAGAKAP